MRVTRALVVLAILAGARVAGARDRPEVTACETLLAARRIDAVSDPGRDPAVEPGCRRIAAGDIGTVERRAMIGGAPYECLTVAGSDRCLWVVR